MKSVINLYKPVGLTPLQTIEKFKQKHLEYKNKKMSYPGRLDPMAQGVLILLVGDENKKMKSYMGLDKEYRAKILFGFSSDTYDILGLATYKKSNLEEREIKKQIKQFKGKYLQKLPPYSSYKIKGKSLFYYARNSRLDEIKIPEKRVVIKDVKVNSVYEISSRRLLKEIKAKIGKLKGDFRQEEILRKWKGLLNNSDNYFVLDVTISCSSGTYIRAIANDLGESLNVGALLLDLKRTRVGKYGVRESEKV